MNKLPPIISARMTVRHKWAGFAVRRELFTFRTLGWWTVITPHDATTALSQRLFDLIVKLCNLPR